MVETLNFSKQAYSAELKKHMYLLKESHVYKKQKHLAPCFPVSILLTFEWNLTAYQGFQVGEPLILFQIGLFTELKTHIYLSKENHLH
jgi:hypothetical protein